MTKFAVPSLSADGWVTSSRQRLDYLLSHFYLSDFSQTFLYTNKVSSLAHVIANYYKDEYAFKTTLQTMLQEYLLRYNFTNVTVDLTILDEEPNSSKEILKIYLSATDELGETITMDDTLRIVNGKFANVVSRLNYG